MIARLLEAAPCVVATGGGACMRGETRERISVKGVSVWLKAESDVLLRRVKRRRTARCCRPQNPKRPLEKLMEERYPIYAEADLTVLSRDVPQDASSMSASQRLRLSVGSSPPATRDMTMNLPADCRRRRTDHRRCRPR